MPPFLLPFCSQILEQNPKAQPKGAVQELRNALGGEVL